MGRLDNSRDSPGSYSNGTYIYLKLYKELRPPFTLLIPAVIDTLLKATNLVNLDLLLNTKYNIKG